MKILLAYIPEDHKVDMLTEAFTKTVNQYHLRDRMEWVSASGNLTDALIEVQKTGQVDIVMMGTFGTLCDGDTSLINTFKMVLNSDYPVLVIPYDLEEFRLKNSALVLGKEEIENKESLAVQLDVARKFNALVHVVTIENAPESYGYSNIDAANENELAYYLENFYSEHTFIQNPDVVEGILSYVSNKNIDLITILPRNLAKKSAPSKGKLTQLLTIHSKFPILAID